MTYMPLHNKYGKPMTAEIKAVLKRERLRASEYIVKQDYKHSVIVQHVITGVCKVLYK